LLVFGLIDNFINLPGIEGSPVVLPSIKQPGISIEVNSLLKIVSLL
jgi:hypothetical protein